jgi:hypothetical protein
MMRVADLLSPQEGLMGGRACCLDMVGWGAVPFMRANK